MARPPLWVKVLGAFAWLLVCAVVFSALWAALVAVGLACAVVVFALLFGAEPTSAAQNAAAWAFIFMFLIEFFFRFGKLWVGWDNFRAKLYRARGLD